MGILAARIVCPWHAGPYIINSFVLISFRHRIQIRTASTHMSAYILSGAVQRLGTMELILKLTVCSEGRREFIGENNGIIQRSNKWIQMGGGRVNASWIRPALARSRSFVLIARKLRSIIEIGTFCLERNFYYKILTRVRKYIFLNLS